jgi:Protein of unknown function (DUF3631)
VSARQPMEWDACRPEQQRQVTASTVEDFNHLHLPDGPNGQEWVVDDDQAAATQKLDRSAKPDRPLSDAEPRERTAGKAGEDGPGWSEGPPVDGAELLDDIERFAGRFLVFPTKHHLVVLCLWAAHTWAVSAFYVTPRLVLDSPEPGSGKTRVLELLALLCQNAKLTLSTTTAALYRRIKSAGDNPPTILQDECDAVFGRVNSPQAEDLRALFNAGYKTGATVDRCEGHPGNMKVVDFPVFAPAALAGLISGPVAKNMRTVLDRAVVFQMRRRTPDEHVDEFRGRDAEPEADPLRKRLRAWADDHFDALAAARPRMPEGVRDRRAECWEAMLAVADAAGGDWPDRAREACRHFEFGTDPDDDRLSTGVRLLRDVEAIFGTRDRMHSADIVAALISDPESEWGHLPGKLLDPRRLAKELKRYGVEPGDIRIGDVVRKGYMVDGGTGLAQAWCRWLSPLGTRDKRNIPAADPADRSDQDDVRDKRDANATAELPPGQALVQDVADVADVADTDGDPGSVPAQHANGERRPPTEDSETTEERIAGQRDSLLTDLDARQQQTNGSVKPRESESDGGEPKGRCPKCGSALGSTTGKCMKCILDRAKTAVAHEYRRQTDCV